MAEIKTEGKTQDQIFAELKQQADGVQGGIQVQEDMKPWYTSLILGLQDVNGSDVTPGPMSSYIPRKNFFHKLSDALTQTVGIQAPLMELALNYKALGKGLPAFLGAAVRQGFRDKVNANRECVVHTELKTVMAELDMADLKTVSGYMTSHINAYLACKVNYQSFLVQAAANLIRMTHHWSSASHKEYTSLIKVMGLEDIIADDQLRPLVYLSVHPCPLPTLETLRAKARNTAADTLIETVEKRKNATPAGYGAAGACFAAVIDLLSEEFTNADYWLSLERLHAEEIKVKTAANEPVPKNLRQKLAEAKLCKVAAVNVVTKANAFVTALRPVFQDPASYCVLATSFGKARKSVNLSEHVGIMCFLAAYIYSKVRGTLAKSPALKKFRSENSVRVSRAQEVMEDFEGSASLSTVMAAV